MVPLLCITYFLELNRMEIGRRWIMYFCYKHSIYILMATENLFIYLRNKIFKKKKYSGAVYLSP